MDEITSKVVRQFLSVLNCTLCGRNYREVDVKVIAHKDDSWFLNVQCSFCGSRNLIAAVVKEMGVEPAATDLTPAESTRFSNTPAIDAGDVLSVHYFLEDFDGDFKKLLQD